MRRAAAADGSQEPPVSPLSLKGLMAENDRLTLRLVAASEIKAEPQTLDPKLQSQTLNPKPETPTPKP